MLNKIFNYALTGSLLLGTAFVGITKYRVLELYFFIFWGFII